LKFFYNKYDNPDKRVDTIELVISKDPIYVELEKRDGFNKVEKIYTLKDIAVCAQNFMELYKDYDFDNPIESKFKDKIYLQPDERHIKREGRKNAGIKYAAHFVTASDDKKKKRHYDTSKIANMGIIKEALERSSDRRKTENKQGELRVYLL